MWTFAPVAVVKRWLAWSTTAGHPVFASLCSHTVIVLPLPSVLREVLPPPPPPLEPQALSARPRTAASVVAPTAVRFNAASHEGCGRTEPDQDWYRRIEVLG